MSEAVEDKLPFKIIKIALYTIMLFLSIVGNGMVVRTISSRTRNNRRQARIPASYLLILNLAICDLATPITSIPFDLALEENSYVWPYGRLLCKILWPFETFFATSASLTLAAISVDRYRFIMHPYTPRLTTKQVKTIVICLHTFSFSLVAPYASVLDLDGASSCVEMWPMFARKVYTLSLFLFQYGLPLPVMFVMYSLALQRLLLSAKNTSNSLKEDETKQIASKQACKPCVIARREQNVRATKMFIIVVLVFTVCMLPNQIFWLWTDFGSGYGSETSKMAGIICRMFTYANSVFNPVIYAIFSQEFQAGFRWQISSISRLFSRFKHSKLGIRSSVPKASHKEGKRKKQRTESIKCCSPDSPPTRETIDTSNRAAFRAKDVASKRHERTNRELIESKEKRNQTDSIGAKMNDQISSTSINKHCENKPSPLEEGIFVSICRLRETDC